MPRAATAAGLAICIGLAASGQALGAEVKEPAERPVLMTDAEAARMQILQSSIVQWYASQLRGHRAPNAARLRAGLSKALPDDPGAKYFLSFAEGKRPEKIERRAQEIIGAFKTEQRSLCLIGIAWRDVTEWCLEGPSPEKRAASERKALRDTVARLGETAEAWRAEIFADKLDPFLRRPLDYRRFYISKAGPSALQRTSRDLATKRWSEGKNATEFLLAEHPYAETMQLQFAASEDGKVQCLRGGKIVNVDGTLRVFDLLLVPKQEGAKPIVLTFPVGTQTLGVTLPPNTELTYGDVLRLVHEQNAGLFEGNDFLRRFRFSPQGARNAVSPLALPELLKRQRQFEADNNAGESAPVMWWLVDLYLF